MLLNPAFTEEKLKTAREMSERIVQRIDPEIVLLFGSVARGCARESSDIDLLIVRESNMTFKERMNVLYSEIDRSDDVDLLWYTNTELETMKPKSSFIRMALREGTVLYERNR